jgi:hypothetical protein
MHGTRTGSVGSELGVPMPWLLTEASRYKSQIYGNTARMHLHIGSGWPVAPDTLNGDGRWWWVTAYLASAVQTAGIRRGDRVLIRGEMRDFTHGVSTLEAVEWLLPQGVKVRRNPGLHAKLYVFEEADGTMRG